MTIIVMDVVERGLQVLEIAYVVHRNGAIAIRKSRPVFLPGLHFSWMNPTDYRHLKSGLVSAIRGLNAETEDLVAKRIMADLADVEEATVLVPKCRAGYVDKFLPRRFPVRVMENVGIVPSVLPRAIDRVGNELDQLMSLAVERVA